tara:strand:+ start:1614 stop:1922 length:309 start_codon:yes stop_codon:yes gene_type:complete
MTTNQEARQATCRTAASSALTVDGDWLAMCDANGMTTGTINERMLKYFNAALGAAWDVAAWDEVDWDGADGNHTNINEAAAAFGESNGITGPGSLFSQLGSF